MTCTLVLRTHHHEIFISTTGTHRVSLLEEKTQGEGMVDGSLERTIPLSSSCSRQFFDNITESK